MDGGIGMDFSSFLASGKIGLYEGSIYERLRRRADLYIDSAIFHACLVYSDAGRAELEKVHREYLDVGHRHGLPMAAHTDTWRASSERVAQSRFSGKDVNGDNARFLRGIATKYAQSGTTVFVGGNIGPRGDAYKPKEAPNRNDAARLHEPQIAALASGGVDFLQATTFPSLDESVGIADVMSVTGLPYVISFVVRPSGNLLDGTPLGAAIAVLDQQRSNRPAGYAINCVHPNVALECLKALRKTAPSLVGRIIGFAANTADLPPEELDGAAEIITEDPQTMADLMARIRAGFGLRLLGGCCGTDTSHIACMGAALAGA